VDYLASPGMPIPVRPAMSTTCGIKPRRFRLAVFKINLPEEGEDT
jgi:hypothetical protein